MWSARIARRFLLGYDTSRWRGSSAGQSGGIIIRRSPVRSRPPLPMKSNSWTEIAERLGRLSQLAAAERGGKQIMITWRAFIHRPGGASEESKRPQGGFHVF